MTQRRCIICGQDTILTLDLGRMPLADAFRDPEDTKPEFFYNLRVVRCPACVLVQLEEPVAPSQMFHGGYPFLTGSSKRMKEHFIRFGKHLLERLNNPSSAFIVELGGNDGTFLAPLAAHGMRVLNVEPSANVAAIGETRGVCSLVRFFDAALADEIREVHGKADAIIAANTVCHVEEISALFEGVRRLLADDGLFIFEDPYLGDILKCNAVDQFYDEHVTYLSLRPVAQLARQVGLEVVDVMRLPTHGGSMRYTLAHRHSREASAAVAALADEEAAAGLDKELSYEHFRGAISKMRRELPELLAEIGARGQRVAGMAATAKSATILNLCRIGPDLLPYIADTTRAKQGKLTPGMHIPVRPYEDFVEDSPPYALLLAWNHEVEIRSSNQWFEQKGHWISYIPMVRIL
jgi:methylation protein EvaC